MRRGARLLGLVLACAAAWVIWEALPLIEQGLHTRPGDGVVDWLGARAWKDHVNIYSKEGLAAYGLTPYGFAHPPTAPFWLLPFTRYDVDGLGTMMGHTTVLLLVFHLAATVLALRLPGGLALAALGFGLVASSSFFKDDLAMAQVSEPIAFFYLLAWLALRTRADVLAGICIGLACTFKPFAGVLGIMLLGLRRWRAAAAAIGAWLVIAAIMTSRFGLISWRQWNAFNEQTAIVWIGHIRNATLPGVVLRLVHPTCKWRVEAVPSLGTTLVSVLLGAALLWLCHRLGRGVLGDPPAEPRRIDLAFAAWSTASVFVNPVAWEHYAFILLTPMAILLAVAADRGARPGARLVSGAAVIASGWLLSIDMHAKVGARNLYRSTAVAHVRVHLLEVANWLPWALVLAAALIALWSAGRSRPAARHGS